MNGTIKSIIGLLLIAFFLPLSVYAGGKKEKEEQKSEVLEQIEGESVETEKAAPTEAETEEGVVDDSVAAVVNGVEILRETVEFDMERFKQQLINSGRPVSDEDNEELWNLVLDGLINRELLFQASEREGLRVTDASVDERIQAIKGQFSDEAQYIEALAQENITEEDLRTDLLVGLSIQQLLESKIYPNISVTEETISDFYNANTDQFRQPEMVQASHILILLSPDADEETQAAAFAKIEKVQEELGNGADFADLAKQYSEGPSNERGGDLGYFSRGQMVPPFEEAAFSLEINQVSDVVETEYGLHLIKVYDKRAEEVLSLDAVKGDIEEYLRQLKTNEAVEQYTEGLREAAKITVF